MTEESERTEPTANAPDEERSNAGEAGGSNGGGEAKNGTTGADDRQGPPSESDGNSGVAGLERERLVTALQWGVLFAFGLLVLVAGAGLYGSLGSIIDLWVADRYQPIARAGVNLAILCAAVAGVVATLRRL